MAVEGCLVSMVLSLEDSPVGAAETVADAASAKAAANNFSFMAITF